MGVDSDMRGLRVDSDRRDAWDALAIQGNTSGDGTRTLGRHDRTCVPFWREEWSDGEWIMARWGLPGYPASARTGQDRAD
jgi:hypothetical protein